MEKITSTTFYIRVANMKVIEILDNKVTIRFNRREFRVLRAATGEPISGFRFDIESTGWKREDAVEFNKNIREALDVTAEDEVVFQLNKEEILFTAKMIEVTLKELETEFHTRTGVFPEEALQVRDDLRKVLENLEG